MLEQRPVDRRWKGLRTRCFLLRLSRRREDLQLSCATVGNHKGSHVRKAEQGWFMANRAASILLAAF